MAIKQDRRANQDEAIQAAGPSRELRVTDVPVTNLEPIMNAEYQRAGLWLNPDLFNDLAEVSDTIHDTRRHSRNTEFTVGLNKVALDQEELLANATRATEFNQKKQVSDVMLEYNARMTEALEKAKRDGTDSRLAIEKVNYEFDRIEDNLSKQSFYMADTFRAYRQQETLSATQTGVKNDIVIAENRAKQQFKTAAAIGISNMVTGVYSFDNYINEMPKSLFPLLDTVTDPEGRALLNENYNAGAITVFKSIEGALKSGSIDPLTAKKGIISFISMYQTHTLKGTDDQGREREVKVELSPETVQIGLGILSDTEQNRNKANSVYTAESYLQMTGAEYAKKGEYEKINYFYNTTPQKAREDWMAARAQLIMDMGTGNESARKQLWEVDNHYWTVVYPQITFRDLMRKSLATAGNVDTAMRDLGSRLISVEDKIRSGDSLENITDFSWTDGTTYINLGYPAPGTDSAFDDFLRRSGVTDYQARFNYYNTIVQEGKKFLESARNSDLIAAMNPTYASSLAQVDNNLTYETLVREDTVTGSIVINESALQNSAELLKKSEIAKRAAAGTVNVGSTNMQLLDSVTQRAGKLNVKQKAVYYQAVARVFTMAGVPDAFTTFKTSNLNNEQKEAVQQIAMWGYLNKTPELRNYANQILTNQVGGLDPNPTPGDANTILKGKLKNSKEPTFLEDIERKLNTYNIPADFKPALRHTLINMAVAAVAGDTEGKKFFDLNAADRLLDANFTKNGTYKFSAALGGVPAEQTDQQITDATKRIQSGMNNLGIKGQITARVDYESGTIKFYSDGQPFMATGTYAPLQGSGMVPFGFSTSGKPAGMPDKKFNDAQSTLIAGAMMNVALSNAPLNAKIQDVLEKNGMTPEEAQKWSYKFMNVMNDQGFQEDWYSYYNSNYSNTRVQSAPNELKAVMIDTLKESHITGDGIRAFFDPTSNDQLNHLIDFTYSRMQSGNSLRIDVPPSAHFESNNFPFFNIDEQVQQSGWIVTSTTGGKHSGKGHYRGTATDVGLKGGFWSGMIPGTDLIMLGKLDSLVNGFIDPNNKTGNIKTILTSHKYLIKGQVSDNDPRYKAYAKYRNMKTPDGKPLFTYWPNHADHFHVEWNKQMYDTKTGKPYGQSRGEFVRSASGVIQTNINDKGTFGFINANESKAMATLFHNYKPTEWDVKNTGRSISELTESPVTRALTASAKYQRGKNALGSSNLAVMGMMGARFKLVGNVQLPSSLKIPDNGFTMEEVITLANKGFLTGMYRGNFRWVIADTENIKRYNDTVNRFSRAGR